MSHSPKSSLEAVITSAPQNATAARVTGKGVHYEVRVKPGDIEHWETPPPVIAQPVNSPELVGIRFGRFLVVGYAEIQPGGIHGTRKKPARWVVRCSCGDYEFRSARAIRNPANSEDRCVKCRQLAYFQRTYKRLGSKSVDDFK